MKKKYGLLFLNAIVFSTMSLYTATTLTEPFKAIRPEVLAASDKSEHQERLNPFVAVLDEHTKMSLVFNLLEGINPLSQKRYPEPNHFISTDVLSDTVLHDIALFKGEQNKKASVFESINRTTTVFGKAMLQHMIANPLTDGKIILHRAKLIQHLMENEHLRKSIKESLAKIAAAEDFLLAFWNYSRATEASFNHVAGARVSEKDLKEMRDELDSKGLTLLQRAFENKLTLDWKMHNLYKLGQDAGQIFMIFSIALYITAGALLTPIMPSTGGPILGVGVLNAFIYYFINYPKYRAFIKSYMQINDTMKQVGNLLHAAKYLVAENTQVRSFISSMEYVNDASNQFTSHANWHLDSVLEMTSSSAVQSNGMVDYYADLKGKVISGFNHMKMLREDGSISNIMKAIGTIDAYVSMAEVTLESEKQRNKFSFVRLLNNETPFIQAKQLWNPMLNPSQAVGNTVQIGQDNDAANIIISGPNAAGKSSFIKSIPLMLILGQSFGVAPAVSAQFTPYHRINTYLNINDDISQGRSLFQMEALRALDLARSITQSSSNNFVFTIMDEIFSGTNPIEGAAGAYSIARSLGEYSNSTLVIASHFPLLHRLESDTNGQFKNYKVSALTNPISYDYVVRPGASNQRIAIDILKEQGHDIKEVLRYAEDIVQNPSQYGLVE